MNDRIRGIRFLTSRTVCFELTEGALASVTACTFPDVTLWNLTPADARKIIDALAPLAQRVETADAAASEAVAR